jgi:1-acyl-sn-glycerol-3-phosphate acyltransferase
MRPEMSELGLFQIPDVPGTNRMWRFSAHLLRPLLVAGTTREWTGERQLPEEGGAIIALNHVSQIDPILATLWMFEHQGRLPSFLAKDSLFDSKAVGWWFRGTNHVRVDRANGADALAASVGALAEGKVLLNYIEGTITRDPDGWPMVPKTGTARLALMTGAPVLPVAQWGSQHLMPAYSGKINTKSRAHIQFNMGEPVDLSDLAGGADDREAVAIATKRIMVSIVSQLEVLRGETAPAELYDPVAHGFTKYGKPIAD